MTWLEAVGYVASILVLSTFYMKTMLPLRCCAIASNIAFIAYGFFGEIYPVLVLHLVLLPLNIKRLHELRQLIRDIKRAAEAGFSFEPMIPFLTKRTFKAGHVLFRRGDRATCLYRPDRSGCGSTSSSARKAAVRSACSPWRTSERPARSRDPDVARPHGRQGPAALLPGPEVRLLPDPARHSPAARGLGRSSRSGRGSAGHGPVSRQERAPIPVTLPGCHSPHRSEGARAGGHVGVTQRGEPIGDVVHAFPGLLALRSK